MYCSRIKSIKKVGLVDTYDLHTPKYHNFFLDNGILSHNSGKSWAMLRTAWESNDKLDLNEDLFFRGIDLMGAMKDNPNMPGKYWLYDEAGIDLNNMNYHDAINKGFNAFFQTGRHNNYVFLMTVPYFEFISKSIRKLFNFRVDCEGYSKKHNLTITKPRVLSYIPEKDIFFKKQLRLQIEGLGVRKLYDFKVKKPPKTLVKEYEGLKKEFTQSLFAEIHAKMEKSLQKESSVAFKSLTPNEEKVIDLLKKGRNASQISVEADMDRGNVSKMIKNIQRKGINITKTSYRDEDMKKKLMYVVDDKEYNQLAQRFKSHQDAFAKESAKEVLGNG